MSCDLTENNEEAPRPAPASRAERSDRGPSARTSDSGPHPASSVPPENMPLAAVVAGASGSIGRGIAVAGSLDMAQGEVEYQRRWSQRVSEARGWQKVWRIIWG